MILWRASITLQGPIASPLASGMIFGQMCWTLRDLEGESWLTAWLAHPETLWGVSDAFPAGCLPRPMLPAAAAGAGGGDPAERKRLKAYTLITRAGFLKHAGGLAEARLESGVLCKPTDDQHSTAHNSIDRHTGRALDQGGLYFRRETWPRAQDAARDLYIEAPEADRDRLEAALTEVGKAGFGKSAGLGRGRFALIGLARETDLAARKGANRFLSLSRGTRTPNMAALRCRIEPHFGKAGARVTLGEGASPFKRPLILTKAGATFARTDGDMGPGRFGAWLTGVHPTRPEIGHNAFHVAIPYVEAADA